MKKYQTFSVHFLISLCVYAFFFDLHTLAPWHTDWLINRSTDLWISFIYQTYNHHAPWHFPLRFSDTITTMQPRGYFYHADGAFNLFSIFDKLLIPLKWQCFGIIWFLSIFLHSFFCIKIFTALSSKTSSLNRYFLSFLTLCSPWFLYRYGHHTLFHQWLILAFFFLVFKYRYDFKIFFLYSLIMMFTASFMHNYFIPMIGILLSFHCFFLYFKKHISLTYVLFYCTSLILTAFLVLYILGYFQFPRSAIGAHGFGYYSANLLTWIDPSTQEGSLSGLLPSLGKGPGQYEGLAYMGLGGFVLIGWAFYNRKDMPFSVWKEWKFLLIACILLAMWAVGPDVMFANTHILDLSWMYEPFITFFSGFRSSGRFIWPLSYLIWIVAGVTLLNHPNIRTQTLVLSICVGLQLADLLALRKEITRTLTPTHTTLTQQHRWNTLFEKTSGVYFYPPFHLNTGLLQYAPQNPFLGPLLYECALRNIPLNSTFFPRVDRADLEKQSMDFMKSFEEGRSDPTGLYVIHPLAQEHKPDVLQSMACESLDGFYVCRKHS